MFDAYYLKHTIIEMLAVGKCPTLSWYDAVRPTNCLNDS